MEALDHHPKMVLLGIAGSGKSTLGNYLALSLAEAALGHAESLKRLGAEWTHGSLLPVRVVLRTFAASLPADLKQGRAAHLWQFIGDELINCGLNERTGKILRQAAAESGALFLLDGLDEAGDETRRARVLEAVAEFMPSSGDGCRFLLTARPYAWNEAEQSIVDARDSYRLAKFDDRQIETFITRWYEAIADAGWIGKAEADQKADDLRRAARAREDLSMLAGNPLLLTLMATLHSNLTRLPDDRADLYDKVVELLLQRWNEPTGADISLLEQLQTPTLTLANFRTVIEKLAFEAHAMHIGKEGAADIPEAALLDAFRPLLGGSRDQAARVVEYVENRAGLLIGQGGARGQARQFTFPHRTFQEYLAACYLADQTDFTERAVALAREAPAHWREVLTLAARHAKPGRGVPTADALIHAQSVEDYQRKNGKPTERDWNAAVLAGEQLLEIGLAALNAQEHYGAVRERVAAWLAAFVASGELAARDRVRAGNVLAQLGDPRFRADAWHLPDEPLLGFVEIREGEFIMGSDPKKDRSAGEDEQPQHKVTLPRYFIARYPVTVAQFGAFARESGYTVAAGLAPALHGTSNHPGVNVTWHDAVAYCDWLTETLKKWNGTPEPLATMLRNEKWRIILPSEAEWEKAARGGDGRLFPWGDEFDPNKANTAETGIGTTSTVGCFYGSDLRGASQDSGLGIFDLSGNVWEWTSSKWKKYPYEVSDGREDLKGNEARVLRGGSWNLNPRNCRSAYRTGFVPTGFSDFFGFRVALSPGEHLES
ncbi:MAG: SUMF1/EgtB/PvdO family nonheme iron enzyme [Chloroflexi bacterium]|nr:SUMF1/EgtB/PvdO family nonheme iron enzyme [Chloroflexota bacterium]